MESKVLPSICIIGAGVAGMSCASLLKKNGYNVKIIEASNRFGGRIRKLSNFTNFDIELGAEEIHGENSEYFKLVKEAGGEVYSYWEENKFYTYYKNEFKEVEYFTKKYPEFDYCWNLFEDITYEMKNTYPDISLKDYLKQNNMPDDVDFIANAMIGVESGTDINSVSIHGFSEVCKNWTSGTNNYLLSNQSHIDIVGKGYADILGDIVYDSPITEIEYNNDEDIVLIDKNGIKYTCDMCVVCVPISQIPKIKFEPVLPEEFSKIKLDSCAKLILKFKESFWPKDASWLILPGSINVYWYAGQDKGVEENSTESNEFILTGMTAGAPCKQMNEIYKNDKKMFIKTILDDLELVFKKPLEDLLLDYYWFDWADVPYIEGGYSYTIINEGGIRDVLRKPINNKLFFAGEACARNGHIATVHGAVESGVESANTIIDMIKMK